MLKFIKHLNEGKIISRDSLVEMQQWNKMWLTIDYGFGLMRIRFLPFTEKYNGWGHLGSIASFMLYFPVPDTYVIGNFNQPKHMNKCMRLVYQILRTIVKQK